MIYFVRSRQGYDQLAASSAWPPETLWVAPDILDAIELATLRAAGVAVTSFVGLHSHSDLLGALETILEHHPGQAVWVDGQPAA